MSPIAQACTKKPAPALPTLLTSNAEKPVIGSTFKNFVKPVASKAPLESSKAEVQYIAGRGVAELLPGRLLWTAKGAELPEEWESAQRFGLASITSDDFRRGRYSVPHYPDCALGLAHGPLSADQTIIFVAELYQRLQDNEQEKRRLVVEFEPKDRHNVAVLLGGYLIFKEGWTPQRLSEALPIDAKLSFPCAWQDPRSVSAPRIMTVADCWAGLELAGRLGWIQAGIDGVTASLSSSRWWRCVSQYDGSWLVPGKIFVMADPMTVVKDPNPNTCKKLTPSGGSTRASWGASLRSLSSMSLSSSASASNLEHGLRGSSVMGSSMTSVREDEEEEAPGLESDENGSDAGTVHSVCKDFTHTSTSKQRWPAAADLVSFFKQESIIGVVRANTGDEPGIKNLGGSYSPSQLESFGLSHLDIAINDTNGAIFPPKDVARMIKWVETLDMGEALEDVAKSEQALAFHCKSGFGRSVLLACCLTIYLYDVPGHALLAWSRIARPGAITNVHQERFLQRLRGREDLQLYMRGKLPGAAGDAACCAVQ